MSYQDMNSKRFHPGAKTFAFLFTPFARKLTEKYSGFGADETDVIGPREKFNYLYNAHVLNICRW